MNGRWTELLDWLRKGIRALKKRTTVTLSGVGPTALIPAPGVGKTITVYYASVYSLNGDVCIFRSGPDELFRLATLKAAPQAKFDAPIALDENQPLVAQLTIGNATTINAHYEILSL